MAIIEPAIIDFETEGIQSRPHYPPKPVGVSIQLPSESKPRYFAWGHPTGNNCTLADARRFLAAVWADKQLTLLFHNDKFDLDVAEVHLKLPMPHWSRLHDSMFLLFLTDPHAPSLALKPAAHRILNMPPAEQDAVKAWVLAHIPEAKKKPSTWGAYICMAPGELVGKYAKGDVTRTLRLFKHCYRHVRDHDMLTAYDRERRLMPYLLESERHGLRIDRKRLDKDIPFFEAASLRAEQWIYKRLKQGEFNLDSNETLVEHMLKAGVAKEELMSRTAPSRTHPAGQLSVAKESLTNGITDKKFLQVLGYRNRMQTCLGTFMRPWLILSAHNGRIHPHWHQVRTGQGDAGSQGARSGRIICTDPNLLNLSKDFEDKDDGYVHPKWFSNLPPLPLVRVYILPDEGQVFGHRDYNQQELRILGHFEDGSLCRRYNEDPNLDVHNFVRDEIHRIRGLLLERRPVKIQNFGMIYGMGLAKSAIKMQFTVEKAKELRRAHEEALPDLKALNKAIKKRGSDGEAIRTWGGREYYVEPPRIVDGYTQTYEYKLLNYLIQGSAADATKEAVIRYHEHPERKEGRFLVTVYDEVNASMPKDKVALKREMSALRESMESVKFDVPMLSDGKVGRSWGELRKYKDQRGA